MAGIDAGSLRAALGQAIPGLNVRSGELGAIIKKAVVDGWSQSQLLQAIYASRTFKARFPGIRNADGSLRMSPAAYIQQETDLRNTMQSFGLGWWHYNKPSDFAGFISRGVTAQDLQHRLQQSQDLLRNNPAIVEEIRHVFGAGMLSKKDAESGALAWLLDPKKGNDFFDQRITAAQISLAARQAGFNPGYGTRKDEQLFLGLAGEGITGAQANQAFQQAGLDREQLHTFAARYHTGELSDAQIMEALFHPDPEVQKIRQQLFGQEAAQFKSGAGFALGQGAGVAGLRTSEAADR